MSKILNSKKNCFGHWKLKFGIYLGFEIWNLGLEIPSHSTYLAADISSKKINKGTQ
jgi:hypothetical protein